jgi:uncharacterized repeat protein (TIGR03803 family)
MTPNSFLNSMRCRVRTGRSSNIAATLVITLVMVMLLAAAAQGKPTSLHDFCPAPPACADGAQPVSNVVFDVEGNLYGTTSSGGAYGYGVVWEITP